MNVTIRPEWQALLQPFFNEPYFTQLAQTLKQELKEGKTIFPPGRLIFQAFNNTPPHKIKAVIIGQDPYHGVGQAHGLSFSVPQGIDIPPSLWNIYKELQNDLLILPAAHGNLSNWAEQGVLLLNASLTVRQNEPMSHSKIGWHLFTNDVIKTIAQLAQPIVFILWGKFAQSKSEFIHHRKHLVIESAHPSPLSARHGFFGSKPFSQTNAWLIAHGIMPIDWNLNL